MQWGGISRIIKKAAHVLNLQLSFFSCVSPTECFCYYDLYPMKIKSKKKVRPSGKFQAQLYFDGRSRYIGVFDSKFEAATAYEMIRRKLKSSSSTTTTATTTITMKKTTADASSSSAADDVVMAATTAISGMTTKTTMRSITPSPTPL